jgi:copper chaperone NosL
MRLRMDRRGFLLGLAAGAVSAACKKSERDLQSGRCNHCGMRIDPTSAWRTELLGADGSTITFDTPWCALTSWRGGKTTAASIRLQDYYDRRWRRGEELRFVIGGDVVGPMGPDVVPVDPARVTKFIQDHSADRALRLEEITPEILAAVKHGK